MNASVIITTFERSHFLNRAIESVLLQKTNYNYEVIIVDDNGLGTKNQLLTEKSIQSYIEQKKVKYYPLESNKGACYARNYGLSKANGEYVFFLDDDDTFENNKVEIQVSFMENNSNLDGCVAPFKRLSPEGNEIISSSNLPVIGDFINFSIRGNFFTPMLCIKKSSLNSLGGFKDIDRFQDRFLMLNALAKKMKFACLSIPLHTMYEHQENRISNITIHKTILSLNKIFNFISQYEKLFTQEEWTSYKINDLTIRATSYYLSVNRMDRLQAAVIYFKICRLTLNKKHTLNFIKSILNIFRIK